MARCQAARAPAVQAEDATASHSPEPAARHPAGVARPAPGRSQLLSTLRESTAQHPAGVNRSAPCGSQPPATCGSQPPRTPQESAPRNLRESTAPHSAGVSRPAPRRSQPALNLRESAAPHPAGVNRPAPAGDQHFSPRSANPWAARAGTHFVSVRPGAARIRRRYCGASQHALHWSSRQCADGP
jgi:hypothetical protein